MSYRVSIDSNNMYFVEWLNKGKWKEVNSFRFNTKEEAYIYLIEAVGV